VFNHLEVKLWLVIAVVWALAWPAWAGTVEGKVEVREPAKIKRNPGSDRYGPGGLKGDKAKKEAVPETENVVISVLELTTAAPAKPLKVSIRQLDKAFVPYLTAIRTGTTVDFPNGDKIFHSVFSESATQKFHLPEYPQGDSRSVTFTKPGHVELFCAIHTHMNAHIMILPNEFFTRPQKNGDFRLEKLPAGKLKIQAWHPKLGSQVKVVEVPKDGTVKVSFALK
jgi:plastocyanin